MFNPTIIFQLQNKWKQFTNNHPKFPMFLKAVSQTHLDAGSVIEVKITTAQGQEICSNVKLSESDLELFQEIAEMTKQMK